MRNFLLVLLLSVPAYGLGGIQWFASWESGLREACRTNRPTLLIAAAPHCHNVSGLW